MVVVQDVGGREIEADVTRVAEPVGSRGLPVRYEVMNFLRDLQPRVIGALPGTKEVVKPRKSLEFLQSAADGATLLSRIHFGGYHRDMWSPILVGVLVTAKDEAGRNRWSDRFNAALSRLPQGTTVATAGPRSLEVLKPVTWTSHADLNSDLADSLARDFWQFAKVTQPLLMAPPLAGPGV